MRILGRTGRMGLLALGLAAFWAGVAAYALHPLLPFNTVRLPFAAQVKAGFWLPEGWAFFTRDPREEQLWLRRRTPEGWTAGPLGAQFQARHAFGLRRDPRAMTAELRLLVGALPPGAWTECEGDADACLERAAAASLATHSRRPALCGSLGVVRRAPVPWAWTQGTTPARTRTRVARMEVSC